jgi:hypothetical protein
MNEIKYTVSGFFLDRNSSFFDRENPACKEEWSLTWIAGSETCRLDGESIAGDYAICIPYCATNTGIIAALDGMLVAIASTYGYIR